MSDILQKKYIYFCVMSQFKVWSCTNVGYPTKKIYCCVMSQFKVWSCTNVGYPTNTFNFCLMSHFKRVGTY